MYINNSGHMTMRLGMKYYASSTTMTLFPTNANLNTYMNSRAKARRTIKSAKRISFRTYVSKLNYKTPTKKVWDMVRKISGKTKTPTYQFKHFLLPFYVQWG